MKRILTIVILLSCFKISQAADIRDSFLVDGVYRNYILHVPTNYSTAQNYPLVLNLHGYTSNADQQLLYTQMNTTSDANDFLVVYPNGIANYWNAFGAGANDVKFLDSLIERIKRSHKIDTRCIYSCGMSNGGFMSYTLACQLSHKIAAIASVTGVLSTNSQQNCALAHKMPVMQIHGTADPTVNYQTGTANAMGVEQTLSFWIDTNNCVLNQDTINVPNTNTTDGCTAQLIRYRQCDASSEVYFYKIAGGGHTWPGAFAIAAGPTNQDFKASTEIWEFFKRHKLAQPNGIDDFTKENIAAIYPIPFDNILKIDLTKNVKKEVKIFDVSGRIVFETKTTTQILEIATSEWSKGVYTIVIEGSSQRVVKF
jgi:polyhydroxybutyrate depolymerase